MSIKLFNAHEIVGFTLDSFLQELKAMRKELEPLKQDLVTRALAQTASRAHDEVLLGLKERPANLNFLQAAQSHMHARQRDAHALSRRDPFYDVSFSVTLIPVSGRLLALTFTDQRQFRQFWNDKPWRRDFAYWDNTDPPEDLPEEEWTDRWATWNEAFGDSWVPGEVGYSYDLVDGRPTYPTVDLTELALVLPTARERAAAQATEYLIHLNKQKGIAEPHKHSEIIALRESAEWTQVQRSLEAQFHVKPLTTADLVGESGTA